MDLTEAVTLFGGQFGLGMYPIAPKPKALGGFVPDVSSINKHRDPPDVGLIMQPQNVDCTILDGGDSAQKTGMAAFCGSSIDKSLLSNYENDGIMVRHPTQAPWNNWKICTRDQLVPFTAGCWRAGRYDIVQRLYAKHELRIPPFTCQNTEESPVGIGDLLGPHDVMAFRIAAGESGAYTDLLGQFVLQCAIEVADKSLDTERNALIVQAIMAGRLDFYVHVHPEYKENIRYYWGGWRKQAAIGEALIAAIDIELQRYGDRPLLPFLPVNVIEFFRSLTLDDLKAAYDPVRLAGLAQDYLEASLKDFANEAVFVARLALAEVTRQMLNLTASINLVAQIFARIDQAAPDVYAALESVGVPSEQIRDALSAAFPPWEIPHMDIHTDVLAIPHIDVAPIHQDIGAVHTDIGGPHVDVPHTDVGGPHVDIDWFGGHTDAGHTDAGHADAGHVDALVSPHIDIIDTPHIDTPAAAHIDTDGGGHIDTP